MPSVEELARRWLEAYRAWKASPAPQDMFFTGARSEALRTASRDMAEAIAQANPLLCADLVELARALDVFYLGEDPREITDRIEPMVEDLIESSIEAGPRPMSAAAQDASIKGLARRWMEARDARAARPAPCPDGWQQEVDAELAEASRALYRALVGSSRQEAQCFYLLALDLDPERVAYTPGPDPSDVDWRIKQCFAIAKSLMDAEREDRMTDGVQQEAAQPKPNSATASEDDWINLTDHQQAIVSYMVTLPRGQSLTQTQIFQNVATVHDDDRGRGAVKHLSEGLRLLKRQGERSGFRLTRIPPGMPPSGDWHDSWRKPD